MEQVRFSDLSAGLKTAIILAWIGGFIYIISLISIVVEGLY